MTVCNLANEDGRRVALQRSHVALAALAFRDNLAFGPPIPLLLLFDEVFAPLRILGLHYHAIPVANPCYPTLFILATACAPFGGFCTTYGALVGQGGKRQRHA